MKIKQIILIFFLLVSLSSTAQQVLMDRGIYAGDLWCFPSLADTTKYFYLPPDASLSLDKEKNPEFSLIRYVVTTVQNSDQVNSIQKAGGGAILHFLVQYNTPKEKVSKAEKALQETMGSSAIKLKGPIFFDKGNYSLISSILTKDGKQHNLLMASGSAPVLEGSKIALSFELEPETSTLLQKSFKMATPDISIVFDMEFSGVADAFDAQLIVDWKKVQQSQHIKASAKTYFVSADIDKLYKNLESESAIQLNTSGENVHMQALIDRMYEKLTDLFFRELEKTEVPETVKEDVAGGISNIIKKLTKSSPIGLHGAYALRDLRSSGFSKINFNARSPVKRHHYIVFNMGDLYKKFGQDEHFFKTVSMDDPDFQQRVIHVGIDGTLVGEMGKMINHVTVTLKKEHERGEQTLREILVTPETLKKKNLSLSMVYGSKGDTDRLKWLQYQYRTNWEFSGGGTYVTDWKEVSAPMINLYAPFKRTAIQLFCDENTLTDNGIRAVLVQVSYPFFGETKTDRITWKTGENIDEKTIDITLPLKAANYSYKITWIKSDGSRSVKEGKDNSGLVFIDEF